MFHQKIVGKGILLALPPNIVFFIFILVFLKDINNYGKINFPYMGLLGSELFHLEPYVLLCLFVT